MLVLLMTAALCDQPPTVIFEQPDELPELHPDDRARTPRSTSIVHRRIAEGVGRLWAA
jgi:hypothetical protein